MIWPTLGYSCQRNWRNRRKGTEMDEELREKSWGNHLAVLVATRGMAMAEHRVWSFYGGRSTKQRCSPFSLSWVAAAKQTEFSGLWNSYREQWAIPSSSSPAVSCPRHLPALPVPWVCSVFLKWEVFLLHIGTVQLLFTWDPGWWPVTLSWHWKAEIAVGVERKN